ncbi:hypothetical protein ACJTED_21040, partial [Klebsiella pneumoniae]
MSQNWMRHFELQLIDDKGDGISLSDFKVTFNIQKMPATIFKEGANKQVISSQADSLIKISRIWADFFPANTSNQPI